MATKPPNTPHNPPETKDTYLEFKKDPRIDKPHIQQKKEEPNDEEKKITTYLEKFQEDEQAFYDELRNYKKERIKEISLLETDPFNNRQIILEQLSELAIAILKAASQFTSNIMQERFGIPEQITSYQQRESASLSIVAMGKLAGHEINYESDLDLIFIYSAPGESSGRKSITNSEYFAKYVQKLINILSIQTIAGRCYAIDTELRPSGNQGTLVSTLDNYLNHQMNNAQNWERLALLRSLPISTNLVFQKQVKDHIVKLLFDRKLSDDFFSSMHQIRELVIKEKVKENSESFDIKLGRGGIMDIEFVLQGLVLKYGGILPDLRQKSLFKILDALEKHTFFSSSELAILRKSYIFLRTLESTLHRSYGRSVTQLQCADSTDESTAALLHTTLDHLKNELTETRETVRNFYNKFYSSTS